MIFEIVVTKIHTFKRIKFLFQYKIFDHTSIVLCGLKTKCLLKVLFFLIIMKKKCEKRVNKKKNYKFFNKKNKKKRK